MAADTPVHPSSPPSVAIGSLGFMASSPPTGNRLRNWAIAIAAIILSAALALGLRTDARGTSLTALAAAAVPFDEALANGKPTLVEFYADWCTTCQAMAADMQSLKGDYGDRVNFSMLNVDNGKWLPEILSYRVDGIPHFVYLDAQGQTQGEAIGEQPRSVLAANLAALIAQQVPLPYPSGAAGTVSDFNPTLMPGADHGDRGDDPRLHGAQVQGAS